MIKRDELKKLGFKEMPHYTVMNTLIYDIGRKRYLSFGDVGTPNEMIWLCQMDDNDDKKMTDLICLHNYDYDGYISISDVKFLMKLKNNERKL